MYASNNLFTYALLIYTVYIAPHMLHAHMKHIQTSILSFRAALLWLLHKHVPLRHPPTWKWRCDHHRASRHHPRPLLCLLLSLTAISISPLPQKDSQFCPGVAFDLVWVAATPPGRWLAGALDLFRNPPQKFKFSAVKGGISGSKWKWGGKKLQDKFLQTRQRSQSLP